MLNWALAILFFLMFLPSQAAAGPPGRVVSLAPSATEMLFALGLGIRVVGVTEFCDYPPEAREKPSIGGMSNPSLEAVVSLRPDLVVMSTDGNPKEFQARLASLGIKTHVLRARRVGELPAALRKLGRAVGAEERAGELADGIEKKLVDFERSRAPRGKALFVIWPEPLLVAGPGTAIDDAMAMLGLENIAAGTGPGYPKYSVEEALRRMPDYIFIGRGHSAMAALSERLLERLGATPAVRSGNVHFVSDRLYRLGPRVVDGIEEMEGLIREGGG